MHYLFEQNGSLTGYTGSTNKRVGAKKMPFDELMDEIWKSSSLPRIAREQFPRSLSDTTKNKLIKKTPEEIAQMFQRTIAEIDGGSTVSIDALVNEKLRKIYSR